jgi:hypothetical protein
MDFEQTANALAWADGTDEDAFADVYLLTSSAAGAALRTAADDLGYAWLAQWAAKQDHKSAVSQRAALVASAKVEWLRGDAVGARAAATAADNASDVPADRTASEEVELRAGALDLPPSKDPLSKDAVDLRLGHDGAQVTVDAKDPNAPDGHDCSRLMDVGFRAAMLGDGGALAEGLQRCSVDFKVIGMDLLAVLPRVQNEKDDLAAALRDCLDGPDGHAGETPFSRVENAALRRDIARAAGLDDDAAAWQAIVDANTKALTDRDRVDALFLWHAE